MTAKNTVELRLAEAPKGAEGKQLPHRHDRRDLTFMAKRPLISKAAADLIADHTYYAFLAWQCDACLTAIARAQWALFYRASGSAQVRRIDSLQQQQAFSDLHSAVVFGSNISKMLWPKPRTHEKARAKAREQRLRGRLTFGGPHGVFVDVVRVRDNLEHVDTRLDTWAANSSKHGPLVLHGVATEEALKRVNPRDRFTWLDPNTQLLSVFGKTVNIEELEKQVVFTHANVVSAMNDIRAQLEPLLPRAKTTTS